MLSGSTRKTILAFLCFAAFGNRGLLSQTVKEVPPPIAKYITTAWDLLQRSTNDCNSVVDSKVISQPVIYLPAGFTPPEDVAGMQKRCDVEVVHLPKVIRRMGDVRPSVDLQEGLLYLPNPYIVPGGRFNEMYGWDSYFIILGLIEDGRVPLAKGIVDNFFFEIANYGGVLNANRTYFLTRSQPPLLTSMISEVYARTHDTDWLRRAYIYAESDYALWTTPDHHAGDTGLARYFDLAMGPVPEMSDDSTYYSDVIRWLIAHPEQRGDYLVSGSEHPDKDEARRLQTSSCDVVASRVCADASLDGFRLSAAFYRGDRAMRESGFDTSFRFGPFSGSTDQYAPVCLNSLLYKYELDLASFASRLGKPAQSRAWRRRAEARKTAIYKYLWNPNTSTFADFNFSTHKASSYRFLSEFYPLWAGLATPSQAEKLVHQLPTFERPGGLAMSDHESGTQWDLPFGWAPAHWFAVEGLRKYGYIADSNRLGEKFLHTLEANYLIDGTIREKYNVVDGSANVAVSAGYKTNVVGFGWTNGVYARIAQLVRPAIVHRSPPAEPNPLTHVLRLDEQGERLQFTLVLSRHGIRPPLEQASAYSSQPWPSWEVPLGHLTPHGVEALRRMGAYMRIASRRDGLFPAAECPASSDIYLYSDTDERNIASTRATFSAFAPGCSAIPIHTVDPKLSDPLFRMNISTGLTPSDEISARRAALLAEVPSVLSRASHTQLEMLQHILVPDPAHPAERSIVETRDRQPTDPTDIVKSSKSRSVASELVEDLLLEYADGKSISEVGWGRVDEATLKKLMPIRIGAFNLEKRTPAFARPARSNLLAHILDTLEQAAKNVSIAGALGPTNARLVYISGHDADLAGISGLLGLHWTADGRTDDTPPDSQIVFELWKRDDATEYTLRVRYRGQTLYQLRTASPLTLTQPPDEVLLTPVGCSSAVGCPWGLFHHAAMMRLSMINVRRDLTPSQIAP